MLYKQRMIWDLPGTIVLMTADKAMLDQLT
jgi:hypothetical protein